MKTKNKVFLEAFVNALVFTFVCRRGAGEVQSSPCRGRRGGGEAGPDHSGNRKVPRDHESKYPSRRVCAPSFSLYLRPIGVLDVSLNAVPIGLVCEPS